LFGVDTPLGRTDTQARLWSLAEALVPGPQPGALNQALMELGATLCSKAAPSCGACPVAEHCRARSEGRVDALPVVTKKRPPRVIALVAVVVLDAARERVLLVRSHERLFGGLWNLPMGQGADLSAAGRVLDGLAVQATLQPRAIAQIEHVLTHRRMQLQLFAAELGEFAAAPDVRLQAHAELAELGVSSLTRKALAAVFRAGTSVPVDSAVAAIPRTY
jgi:A/G-specific adenine glycosylase